MAKRKVMDLEFLKKNYIRDWGGCDNCGSEDLDFSESAEKSLGLPTFMIKCRNCGSEWQIIGTID